MSHEELRDIVGNIRIRMCKNNTDLTQVISGSTVTANRPMPITSDLDIVPYSKNMPPEEAVDALCEGYYVMITDFYSSGLLILNKLTKRVKRLYGGNSYLKQRIYRSKYNNISNRLLVVVKNHKLAVKKAPKIGWFKILYSELNEFALPFVQVQGLNSSWQWYRNGVKIPVIKNKIHPWYGTYFPTRFEHLYLFNDWLTTYEGNKSIATDIGTGCGILSIQMLEQGFKKVLSTDSNPNAILSFNEYLKSNNLSEKIDLIYGDLFAGHNEKYDLIVFNPPWLPLKYENSNLDKAIYYDDDLFPRFFENSYKNLKKDGKLIIIFSNLGKITLKNYISPIENELLNYKRFKTEKKITQKVGKSSERTKRNQSWRSKEEVELWILNPI